MFYRNLFYFDIETVSNYRSLDDLRENNKVEFDLFDKKFTDNVYTKGMLMTDIYIRHAPVISTFGRIICISFGYYSKSGEKIIRSICGEDEKDIVRQFNNIINQALKKYMIISGYGIKFFDIPWILHKSHKYGIETSKVLDIYGKKQWELPLLDMADEWKQGLKIMNSFDEVCYELGVESPKKDISGSLVHDVYWNDHNLDKIRTYCEGDVKASMEVAEKMFQHKV